MQIKTTIILCLLTVSLFAQQRIDINLAYPITGHFPSTGIISAELKYNRKLNSRGLFASIGPTYNEFKDFDKIAIHNFGIDIGLNKEIEFSASVNLYPLINFGYSYFNYLNTKTSTGLQTQVGLNICHTNIGHWVGLHFSYNYFLVDQFNYFPKYEIQAGNFGLFKTGIHFNL